MIDAGRFSAGYYEDKVKKGDRCSALLLGAFALRLRNATLSTYAVTATTNVAADSVSRDGLKTDPRIFLALTAASLDEVLSNERRHAGLEGRAVQPR